MPNIKNPTEASKYFGVSAKHTAKWDKKHPWPEDPGTHKPKELSTYEAYLWLKGSLCPTQIGKVKKKVEWPVAPLP